MDHRAEVAGASLAAAAAAVNTTGGGDFRYRESWKDCAIRLAVRPYMYVRRVQLNMSCVQQFVHYSCVHRRDSIPHRMYVYSVYGAAIHHMCTSDNTLLRCG